MPCSPTARRSGAIAPSQRGSKKLAGDPGMKQQQRQKQQQQQQHKDSPQKQSHQQQQQQQQQRRHRKSSRSKCEVCPMLSEISLVRRVIDSPTFDGVAVTVSARTSSIGQKSRGAGGVAAAAPSGFWLRQGQPSEPRPRQNQKQNQNLTADRSQTQGTINQSAIRSKQVQNQSHLAQPEMRPPAPREQQILPRQSGVISVSRLH